MFSVEKEPENLQLLFEWDSIENARHFLQSPDLMNAMKQAGVIEQPEITYLDCVEHC